MSAIRTCNKPFCSCKKPEAAEVKKDIGIQSVIKSFKAKDYSRAESIIYILELPVDKLCSEIIKAREELDIDVFECMSGVGLKITRQIVSEIILADCVAAITHWLPMADQECILFALALSLYLGKIPCADSILPLLQPRRLAINMPKCLRAVKTGTVEAVDESVWNIPGGTKHIGALLDESGSLTHILVPRGTGDHLENEFGVQK